MLPTVVSLESVEMIRDGGSLRATYRDCTNDLTYALGFPIKLHVTDRGYQLIGYRTPWHGVQVLIEKNGLRVGHKYENIETLSWTDARVLLMALGKHFVPSWECDRRCFDWMVYIAEHEGQLPPGIIPNLQAVQRG